MNLKKQLLLIPLLTIGLFTTYCKDEVIDAGLFSVSPDVLSFEGAGGSSTIIIESSSSWEVEYFPSWCTLSTLYGPKGITNVELTVNAHKTGEEHDGEILFRDQGFLILSVSVRRDLTDREVLEILYNTTGGENWLVNTNWGSDLPLSQWAKIRATDDDRVTSIGLNDNNLTGTIPPQITKLTKMEDFEVTGNSLSGILPEDLGNLQMLTTFGVGSNSLSGQIPVSICDIPGLFNVYMPFNNFSGGLPENLGNLTKLTYFSVNNNELIGNIPLSVSNLSSLSIFNISKNQMDGTVPEQVTSMSAWPRFISNGWINPQQDGHSLIY